MENNINDIKLDSNSIINKLNLYSLVNSNGIRFLFVMSPDIKGAIDMYQVILTSHVDNILVNSNPDDPVRVESYNYFSGCSLSTLCTVDVISGEVESYSSDLQNKDLLNIMTFEPLYNCISSLLKEVSTHGI